MDFMNFMFGGDSMGDKILNTRFAGPIKGGYTWVGYSKLGIYATYSEYKGEIRICDDKSRVQMPVPFKKFETNEEFIEYVDGMIDMMVSMRK